MPEIKHNFTTGKMNKDLDERLVQNGEYRHAVNIQVSTSEDSDVGSVQNILGNKRVDYLEYLPDNNECVGSIADEKNDKIYWFVTGSAVRFKDAKIVNGDYEDTTTTTYDQTDWDNNGEAGTVVQNEWALVADLSGDQLGHGMSIASGVLKRDNTNNGSNSSARQKINIVSGVEYHISYKRKYTGGTDNQTNVFIDPYVDGTPGNSQSFAVSNDPSNSFVTVTDTFTAGFTGEMVFRIFFDGDMEGEIDNVVISSSQQASRILEYDKVNDVITPVFIDMDNSILKFTNDKITGINIINDLLYFTDGTNEPKKINIQRSIENTVDGNTTTTIIDDTGNAVPALEENITVIKKSPINAPTIQYNYFRDPTLANTGFINIANVASNPHTFINSSRGRIHDFSTIKVGDTFDTIIETDENFSNDFNLSWQAGTNVVLKAFNLDNTPPSLPLQNYDLKGYITDWNNNEFTNTITAFPIEHTNNQGGWTSTGNANEYYYNGGSANYKLIHYFYYNSIGNQLLDSHKFKLKFELAAYDDGVTQDLEGRLKVRLFNNIGDDGSSLNVYEVLDLDDITTSEAGVYEFEIPEQSFNNYISQDYPSSVYFEAKDSTTGSTPFTGIVKNVELTRIDVQVAKVRIKVTSIAGTPPAVPAGEVSLGYAVDIYEDVESLFDLKFARFAYRYKYADNEYSCFSPFSHAVFAPGNFAYHPVEGYNIGMENTVKDVTLKNLNDEMPSDVIAIDILYKEDDSTAVYLVDTIKTSKQVFDYNITNDTVKGVLPENQLTRVYDNVPIKAKAQEVLGNRIVYGNYQQNYDLEYYSTLNSQNEEFNISLNTKVNNLKNNSNLGEPSIKSSRNYQVGVVYSDEYGRQTPVLTNSDAVNEVQLLSAPEINTLQVQINSDGHPVNANYFKFYVKDIGGEYFNLAMDRWYDAEDGNVWLSFASSDRSKIEIDDYLLLKKGIDNNTVDLTTKNKYKVIDIKNEAPDFIKANKMLISSKFHNNTGVELWDASLGCEIPALNGSSFSVKFSRYNSSGLSELESLFNNRSVSEEYFLQVVDEPLSSNRYKIFNIEKTTGGTPKFIFSIEGVFGSDMSQFNDDPTGVGVATQINDGASLRIFKEKIENSPKFEGRFFVKIFRDEHYNQFISSSIENEDIEYTTSSSTNKKLYYFKSKNNTNFNGPDYNGNTNSSQIGDLWGAGITGRKYNDASTWDVVGAFPLGKTATDPPNYANATLYKYIQSHKSIIKSLADFDYADDATTTDPNFANKKWPTSLALRAWYRGINTELDPDEAAKYRVPKLDLEADRDNTNFEDVWYFNEMKNSYDYPYYTGFAVSNSYPIANSAVSHSGWKQRTAYTGYSDSSIINIGFGGIEPQQNTGWADTGTTYPYSDGDFFDLINHSTFAPTQGAFIKKLAAGSQFKFKEDPTDTVYTINDVVISYLINYDNLCEDALYNDTTSTYDAFLASNENQFLGNKNIVDAVNNGNTYYENEYNASGVLNGTPGSPGDPADTVVHYRAPSFLTAHNFSVNYQLLLNKDIVWNPVGTPGSEISGGVTLTIPASTNPVGTKVASTGIAKIVLESISGTTDTGETMTVEEGMVLHAYEDGGSTTRVLGKKAIVSNITFDDTTNKFTIKFRAYSGNDDDLESGTGNGKIGDITASDNLVFKQYYMNGMCPNTAKNLNYFREGGESLNKTGVAPLGYTMQFVTVVDEDQSELSANPAVWETESKKDKNLDIYYEASNYYKISKDKLSEIIPVGSKIEHIESNGVPSGVTITNVTDAGDITLSQPVTVVPTIDQPVHIQNRFI